MLDWDFHLRGGITGIIEHIVGRIEIGGIYDTALSITRDPKGGMRGSYGPNDGGGLVSDKSVISGNFWTLKNGSRCPHDTSL